jgi:DNA polymerase-4
MAQLGIETGADLRAKSLDWLARHFGSSARYYHDLARGICHREVKADRPYKSVSAERTFDIDLVEEADLRTELDRVSLYAWNRVERAKVEGRTVTLKVKYADFRTITRSRSLARAVAGRDEFLGLGSALLASILPVEKGVRLIGLGLSNLSEEAAAAPREPALPL